LKTVKKCFKSPSLSGLLWLLKAVTMRLVTQPNKKGLSFFPRTKLIHFQLILSNWSRLRTWIFPSTSGFWDNWTFIRQKRLLVQYIRAHILEANFFLGFWLSLCYWSWSYSYVQKIWWQDPSATSSFGEIFNFLRPKNGVKFHLSMPWN
jgi:hypothetical protein